MPRPKPHYTVALTNHHSRECLKVEMIDLPLAGARSYRLRVNGQWARKLPVASKTAVMRQLRGWSGSALNIAGAIRCGGAAGTHVTGSERAGNQPNLS